MRLPSRLHGWAYLSFVSLWFLFVFPVDARPWTTRDTVEMSRAIGQPRFSPDGAHFCVTASRGVISTNEIESTIWCFDVNEVKRFCANARGVDIANPGSVAHAIVKISAPTVDETGYATTISNLRWAKNSEKFYYLARGRNAERRLFSYDLKRHQCRQLSFDGRDVSAFDLSDDMIVFVDSKWPDPAQLYQAGPGPDVAEVVRGGGLSSSELMFPNLGKLRYGLERKRLCYVAEGGKGDHAKPVVLMDSDSRSEITFLSFEPTVVISPDARYVVYRAQVQSIPTAWENFETRSKDYPPFKADKSSLSHVAASKVFRPEQICIVDLKTGKSRILIDAPLGRDGGYHEDDLSILWSSDSKRVVVANTFFPPQKDSSVTRFRSRPCIVLANIDGPLECVAELDAAEKEHIPIWDLHWDKSGAAIEIEGNGFLQKFERNASAFASGGTLWIAAPGTKAAALDSSRNDLQVLTLQSTNRRPTVVACLAAEKFIEQLIEENKFLTILDPDPQLKDVDLGDVSVYKWADAEGRECVGGLAKPPDFKPGVRYPLLLQTHSFNQFEFFSCGASPTGFPGRAAAARGMIVLQCGEPRRGSKYRGTTQEAEKDGRGCYVAAIEKLASQGLIDPAKVGIIGWSRTGWYVLDTLINEPKYFRAATLADANSSSYGEYLRNLDFSNNGSNYLDTDYSKKPFGEGLKVWIDRASGFNLDKVHAPVLVEYDNPYGLLDWSTYPVLRMLGKPVDLLYFRDGTHTESKPKLAFVSMETNLDWFDFWLNNHEDSSDPSKVEQYQRWRELRQLQEKLSSVH